MTLMDGVVLEDDPGPFEDPYVLDSVVHASLDRLENIHDLLEFLEDQVYQEQMVFQEAFQLW